MERKFNKGDRIVCMTTGVVGRCTNFYTPTGCEEQTMVSTDDGRRYHAPTSEWELADKIQPRGYEGEEMIAEKLLNPYGEYLVKFAQNHGLSTSEAAEQPMVKARLEFFNLTGM